MRSAVAPMKRVRRAISALLSGDLVRGAALLSSSQYVAAIVGFATTAIAARWLGPAQFGEAAVVMAFPALVATVVSVKTGPVIMRYAVLYLAAGERARVLAIARLGFTIDFAAAVLTVAVVTATVAVAGGAPGAPAQGTLTILFALALPFASFGGTGRAVVVVLPRLALVASLQIADKLVLLGLVTFLLTVQASATAFVLATAVAQAVSGAVWLIASSVALRRAAGWWWRAESGSLHEVRRELPSVFGWNFFGVTLSGLLSQLPVLLLGALRSPGEGGYFRLAWSVMTVAGFVEQGLSRAAYPRLAAVVGGTADVDLSVLLRRWVRREGAAGAGVVVLAMAIVPVFVPLALGPAYKEVILASEMLLVGVLASTVFFFVMPVLYLRGAVRTWVLAYGAASVASLTGGLLLVPAAGVDGFAGPIAVALVALNVGLGVMTMRSGRDVERR